MTKFNSKQTQPSLDWLDENESFSGCDFIDSFDEFDLPPKDIDMENLDRLADELSEELDPNGEFDFPIQKVASF